MISVHKFAVAGLVILSQFIIDIYHAPVATVTPFTPLHLYFVSATGSDAANGLTPATAWATPNHNVVCGDVILVNTGTYSTYALNATVSNCPSTSGGIDGSGGIYFAIVLCAGPDLNSCNLNAVSTGGNAIEIDSNNWAIEGYRINGNGGADSRGIESNACASGTTINHHHASINNVIFNARTAVNTNDCALNHNVPGNGTDYWAAVGNIGQNAVQDNICVGSFDAVAPSFIDTAAGTHLYMYGNFGFNDLVSCMSDGEAFMYDTLDAHGYPNQSVIQNNIGVKSERFGIQLFYQAFNSSTPHVFVQNNTLFANNAGLNNDFSVGDLNVQAGNGATNIPWVISVTNNISKSEWAWQGNGNSSNAGSIYAFQIGGNYTSTTIGGSGTQNVFKGQQNMCAGNACDAGDNVTSFGVAGNLGTNTYTDPLFANESDLLSNQMGVPTCIGFVTTTACMGWNANTSTLTTPSLISDLQPSCVGCSGKGYQLPSVTCAANSLYPTWLKGVVYLHASGFTAGATITQNFDLVTKPCGL